MNMMQCWKLVCCFSYHKSFIYQIHIFCYMNEHSTVSLIRGWRLQLCSIPTAQIVWVGRWPLPRQDMWLLHLISYDLNLEPCRWAHSTLPFSGNRLTDSVLVKASLPFPPPIPLCSLHSALPFLLRFSLIFPSLHPYVIIVPSLPSILPLQCPIWGNSLPTLTLLIFLLSPVGTLRAAKVKVKLPLCLSN
jgi:hypothetical protein